MKIRINFKTPDAVYFATATLDDEPREEAEQAASLFIRHGESVTIEIDTQTATATVLKA